MDGAEIRLECLKLARSGDLNITIATAKAYEEYVVGPKPRTLGLPVKPQKKDANPFE